MVNIIGQKSFRTMNVPGFARKFLKESLPRPLWLALKRAPVVLGLFRLWVAQTLLPNHYFVQMQPDFNVDLGYFPDFTREMQRYNRDVSLDDFTLKLDGTRLLTLRLLLKLAARLPEGDYAELGTWRGHSARVIYREMAEGSTFHSFDTFEGFDESDIRIEQAETGVNTAVGHFSDTSLDQVRSYVLDGGEENRLFLHRGRFPETFEGEEARRWRFVHLDADLYSSMLAGFECFYPRLVPGGIIFMHDYNGGYEGVRKAAAEYFGPLGITPVPYCDKSGSAVVIKPLNAPGTP